MIKIAIFISLFSLFGYNTKSQALKKSLLLKEELAAGIISKYEYLPPKGIYHRGIKLTLFKNGRYEYFEADVPQSLYSAGNWRRVKKSIILKSDIQQTEVPINIKYVKDSTVNNSIKIRPIFDKNGNEQMTCYVLINNDSTICYPSHLFCKGTFAKIDSVKVIFGDRMSSKWVRVTDRPLERLIITLDTDNDLMGYVPMNNKRFLLKGNSIIIKWRPLSPLLSVKKTG